MHSAAELHVEVRWVGTNSAPPLAPVRTQAKVTAHSEAHHAEARWFWHRGLDVLKDPGSRKAWLQQAVPDTIAEWWSLLLLGLVGAPEVAWLCVAYQRLGRCGVACQGPGHDGAACQGLSHGGLACRG